MDTIKMAAGLRQHVEEDLMSSSTGLGVHISLRLKECWDVF